MALLEGHNVSKSFGGVLALSQVDFAVESGTIVGLIGPNGAGKTTLFNAVAGAFKPTSGRIVFDEADITGLPADAVCRLGMARTFQVTRPFAAMTCLENVMVAAVNRHPQKPRAFIESFAREKLSFVGLAEMTGSEARQLNVVQKKRLEMARALATEPRLLMLDEVLGGLNTQEISQAVDFIRSLRDRLGLTVLWIEHVMGAIMQAAERVIVLDQGRVLMAGTPSEVVNDPRVIQAYLGD
ncbi:MAG: ABC transporter ATP-binding protein [Desulfobacterales bacterium]|jgi:branched-chain amino acid transport system ATP-binding protein|nr:ABC transporter ATP-binding protein [Desulfobacterales bacterium]